MRTKIVRIITALFVVAGLTGTAMSALPLADKVPEDAMAYAGWSGRSLTFNGSMFGQLIAEPGVKDLFGAIKTAASKGLEMTGEQDAPAMFESIWAMAAIAWQKPSAAALLDITIPRGDAAAGPDEPMPVGFILIDLAKDKAAFDAHFQKLLVLIAKQHKSTHVSVGNLSYSSFTTPAGPCSTGYVGNVFFISLGEGMPMKIALVVNGKSRSLANLAEFKAAMKEVAGEQVQMAYYADVPRLLTIAEKITPTSQPATAPAGQSEFRKIVKAMGIDGVTAVAGASNIVDRGFHEKCRIFSPAPHRGMLMLAAGKPLGAAAMSGIPADADYVAAINLDPAKALAEIKRVATAIDPGIGKQVERMLAKTVDKFGVDIEKDLLAYMGDQWTIVSAPSLGGTLTGTAIIVQLKDAAKFSAALAKLEAQIAKIASGLAPTTMSVDLTGDEVPPGIRGEPFVQHRKVNASIQKYKSGEIEVHYFAMPGDMPIPAAPAWAVHKGKLYIAAFPQVVAALAGGTTQKPLAQSATFASFRKRMSSNASAISYTNTPSLVRRFYGVVLLGGTAATNMLGKFAPAVKPEMLPPLPKVEKYLWPQIAAISSDAKGITIESYGSMPSYITSWMSNLSIQGPALATSILLPTLAKARGQTQQAVSASNLRSIYISIAMYEADNNDKYPPDLLSLLGDYLGDNPDLLMSPSSGRKVRKDSKGKPIGPFDYIYLGAGLKTTDIPEPAEFILAYERPEINKFKGTNCLFADGHVAWLSMGEFQRELAKTQEWISKQNK